VKTNTCFFHGRFSSAKRAFYQLRKAHIAAVSAANANRYHTKTAKLLFFTYPSRKWMAKYPEIAEAAMPIKNAAVSPAGIPC